MRRIIWTQSARSDLESIRSYIGRFSPWAAEDMTERLISSTDSLSEFSECGRPIGGTRRELTIIWPYLIRYRVDGDIVYILRIRHGARRPMP